MAQSLEERVAKLEQELEALKSKLSAGSGERHPLADIVGMGANNPMFDEWQKAIEERRREIDADPDIP